MLREYTLVIIFVVAVIKYQDQKQLKEERIYFGLSFQRARIYKVGKAWERAAGTGSWLMTFCHQETKRVNWK